MADDSCDDYDESAEDCKRMNRDYDDIKMSEMLLTLLKQHRAIMTNAIDLTNRMDTKFKYVVTIKEL